MIKLTLERDKKNISYKIIHIMNKNEIGTPNLSLDFIITKQRKILHQKKSININNLIVIIQLKKHEIIIFSYSSMICK